MKRMIRSSVYERPLEPEDYEDPLVEDDFQEEIELDIDARIHVDVKGNWTYEGPDGGINWAKNPDSSDGVWRAEHDSHVYIADASTIAEDVDELLVQFVPMDPGTYHVTGYANLLYDVSGLEYFEEDGDVDYLTDTADVTFDYDNSELVNIELTKL